MDPFKWIRSCDLIWHFKKEVETWVNQSFLLNRRDSFFEPFRHRTDLSSFSLSSFLMIRKNVEKFIRKEWILPPFKWFKSKAVGSFRLKSISKRLSMDKNVSRNRGRERNRIKKPVTHVEQNRVKRDSVHKNFSGKFVSLIVLLILQSWRVCLGYLWILNKTVS